MKLLILILSSVLTAVPFGEAVNSVDLGLSVNWGTCNIGASSPEDYGEFFAWGELEEKETYDWSTYKWYKDGSFSKYGPDGKTRLDPEDDVAHVRLGGRWRMPTDAEWAELRDTLNCSWTWIDKGDIQGYVVSSNKPGYSGASIFIPASGYHWGSYTTCEQPYGGYNWSSDLSPEDSRFARFSVHYSGIALRNAFDRSLGIAVRPVCEKELPVEHIEGLRNPDRGFHVEATFLVGKDGNLYNPYSHTETSPEDIIPARFGRYARPESDHLVLVQQYIYLTEWIDRELDENAIAGVRRILQALHDSGKQAILRFAYSWNDADSLAKYVTIPVVRRHIEQLDEAGIFRDFVGTIAAMQSGFFGNWGEWAWALPEQRVAVLDALAQHVPEERCITMRYPEKERLGLEGRPYIFRIGYNNDYFTAREHHLAVGNDYVGEIFNYVKRDVEKNGQFVVGEMPYPQSDFWGLKQILNVSNVLRVLKAHRYSAFDIDQNYAQNVVNWMNSPVTRGYLDTLGLLYDDSYFFNDRGEEVARSAFEFIRDHLGYRLNIKSGSSSSFRKGRLSYEVCLTNTGFATVVNPKKVSLVLLNAEDEILMEIPIPADTKSWVPCNPDGTEPLKHVLSGTVKVGRCDEARKVGLRIWDPSQEGFDVSCAPGQTNTIIRTSDGRTVNLFQSYL